MSKLAVVSIKDSAVQSFMSPMFAPAVGGIVRQFGDEVKKASTPERPNNLNEHPEDFELVWLAEFDDETGEFSKPEGGMRVLARGLDYKEVK